MNIWLESNVEKKDPHNEEIWTIVDGIVNQSWTKFTPHSELSCFSIRLHEGQE